ncbi:hypothetical protein GMYAFLOJ_CDS0040 [Microbacterium phage phiMiGM15]
MPAKPKGILALIGSLTLRKASLAGYAQPEAEPVSDLVEANIVTSAIEGLEDRHLILIDLDVPAYLLPSSTEGHSHLYIDTKVTTVGLQKVLDALADVGVVERGYADASRARGYSALRLPWVKKAEPKSAPIVPFLGTPDPF